MDSHTIKNKFFVLDLPYNLISEEARQDSDLILHEYESVIPEVIKNLGSMNLSSCFLSEKSELSNLISNERRNYNQPWNKRDPSWRKLSDMDKKSENFSIKKKFSPLSLKKVKAVEIKLFSNNSPNAISGNKLAVSKIDRFSIEENKTILNNPKSQVEIGKIIGSILKTNVKETSSNIKHAKYNGTAKNKIQDIYVINQIYKMENCLPVWYVLCNYTSSSKSNAGLSEFTMGPFSSECIVSFYKQGDITEETKLKIDKAIIKEEKTPNSKIYALLNNQQGIKVKNLLKALNHKDESGKKRKKSFNKLSYKVDSADTAYYYEENYNYSPYSTSPNEPSSTKSNQGKKINYSSGASSKKDSYEGNKNSSRQSKANYSDEYYYNQIMKSDDRL